MVEIHSEYIYGKITLPRCQILEEFRPYGTYVRNGVERIRNYNRTLKNGRGMNCYELLGWQIDNQKKHMSRLLLQDVFK